MHDHGPLATKLHDSLFIKFENLGINTNDLDIRDLKHLFNIDYMRESVIYSQAYATFYYKYYMRR